MATADNTVFDTVPTEDVPRFLGLPQTPGVRTALLSAGAALILAIMVGIWLWSQQPEYRVLFSNFNDKDGGAIVASLQQMNVPYKYSDSGTAILVPANQVHDARLKLATQGLPKGGNVGFELMENQKLGISQFLEQVNFQRALEGELARTIQSVSSVQSARVHLAIPKASVFVREQQSPTASVLLSVYPGRVLDQSQVNAILHLVASSVPELSTKNVSIVDQNGNLLSDPNKQAGNNNLDPAQIKYVQDFQENIVKRVESIISPIVGKNNVRAEATADIDFSRSEQAAESYRPNSPPEASTIRSQQTSESYNKNNNPSGIPGALTNQPPAPATAPIVSNSANTANATQSAASSTGLVQKDTTTNYEVDKTVRYTQQNMGGVKRISVAIVLNYKSETDKSGKVITRPLTDIEKTEITDLAKEAMGFNKERGDTLNVVNSPFAGPEKEVIEDLPLWKQPETVSLAKEIGKYLLVGGVLAYLFFGYLKPILYKIMGKDVEAEKAKKEQEEKERIEAETRETQAVVSDRDDDDAVVSLSTEDEIQAAKQTQSYEQNLELARMLAKDDPRIVANVIKTWVNNE